MIKEFFEQARIITGTEIQVYIMLFISLIAPSVISIWIYAPDLIKDAPFLTVLLLSMCISMPIAFANYLVINVWKKEESKLQVALYFWGFGSMMLASGFAIPISLIFSLSWKGHLLCFLIFNILTTLAFRQRLDDKASTSSESKDATNADATNT